MKSKLLFVAAAAIMIISYVSCQWLKEKPAAGNALSGTWQAVNIADSSKDSSKNGIGLFLFSLAAKDTLQFHFTNDSTHIFTSKEKLDSSAYLYAPEKQQLRFLKTNDTTDFYVTRFEKDTLELISNDSLIYRLHRIK